MTKTIVETIRRLHLPSRLLAWIFFGRFASDDQRRAETLRSVGGLGVKAGITHDRRFAGLDTNF